MSRNSFSIFIILIGLLSATSYTWGDVLATSYSDVMLQQIPVGRLVRAQDELKHDLTVKNGASHSVTVQIDVLIPEKSSIVGNAQAIADSRWIVVSPHQLELPAHGSGTCIVSINVPSETSNRGKFYEALVWTHTIPKKGEGVTLSAGLLSRIRFTTRP